MQWLLDEVTYEKWRHTRELAHDMVALEMRIREARRMHRPVHDLEQAREELQVQRSTLLREMWRDIRP